MLFVEFVERGEHRQGAVLVRIQSVGLGVARLHILRISPLRADDLQGPPAEKGRKLHFFALANDSQLDRPIRLCPPQGLLQGDAAGDRLAVQGNDPVAGLQADLGCRSPLTDDLDRRRRGGSALP